jgi:hypothetical protein
MANGRILLGPASWVVNEDHEVSFRYRVVTNDLNVRSAFSPTYVVAVPAIAEIFNTIDYGISSRAIGSQNLVDIVWSLLPRYDNMPYYVFIKAPGATDFSYLKLTYETSFSHILPASSPAGVYSFTVTMPTTGKTALANAILFSATITI